MCATCPHSQPAETGPWFNHVWHLYRLQQGGYPFEKNDLDVEEWLGLAELKAAMETPPETAER